MVHVDAIDEQAGHAVQGTHGDLVLPHRVYALCDQAPGLPGLQLFDIKAEEGIPSNSVCVVCEEECMTSCCAVMNLPGRRSLQITSTDGASGTSIGVELQTWKKTL